jgi:hypothetical protein
MGRHCGINLVGSLLNPIRLESQGIIEVFAHPGVPRFTTDPKVIRADGFRDRWSAELDDEIESCSGAFFLA